MSEHQRFRAWTNEFACFRTSASIFPKKSRSANKNERWTLQARPGLYVALKKETSREWHKSAPYRRLKNSNRTSKCPVFFYSTRKTQKLNRIGAPFWIFLTTIVAKHQKNEGDPLKNFFKKSLTMPKKTEKRDPLVSPGTVCYAEKYFWFSSLD